jgi:hypothetical protein
MRLIHPDHPSGGQDRTGHNVPTNAEPDGYAVRLSPFAAEKTKLVDRL